MSGIGQDVRYALRALARSPGFAVSAVGMLALAIGANTALFSVLEEAVLSEPPFPEPERLIAVDVMFSLDGEPGEPTQWSYPRYQALRADVRAVEAWAGYASRTMTLSELGDPEVVMAEVVTPSIFPLLGIGAAAGRVFGPEEVDAGAPVMVALVSHAFWTTRLGASPGAVGRTLTLDRHSFRVIGVLAPEFDGVTGGADVWIPMSALREVEDASALEDPWNQQFRVLGRVAAGVSIGAVRQEVRAFGATVMERFPPPRGASRMEPSADVVGLAEARVNPLARTSTIALFGAVLLVLLIATANLAGLLLARGAARRQEAAVRASLGAGRARLVRQLLTESVTTAVLGGALGVVVAWVGVDALGAWLADAIGTGSARGLRYLDPAAVDLDVGVFVFALLLTGGVGIAFGLLPALQTSRADLATSLSGARATGSGSRGGRSLAGHGVIVVQVAVAIVLLSGASLMMRTMASLQNVETGYEPKGLLTAMYSLTVADEAAGIDPSAFHEEFIESVRTLPGVSAATLGEVPLGGPTWRTIVMGSEGRPDLVPEMHTWIRLQAVPDGHLAVMGTRLLEGRSIDRSDGPETDLVVVINRSAARALFPDGSPLGRRLQLGPARYQGEGATVVGVVEDVRFADADAEGELQAYLPLRQTARLETGVLVRTSEPDALARVLRSTLADLAPHVALTSIMTMEDRAARATARPRVVTTLLGLFGVASLLLVASGLYGTIAFAVASRAPELGLRASLGAGRLSLLALVLRRAFGVTLAGVVLGVAGSLWATRLLEGLLFGTAAVDPVSLAGVSALLLAVALVAAYVPARRATRIDPMTALRA